MHRAASKRVTRSSGSGLKQLNVECGGPTVNNVSEQGKTSEAGSLMPNDANENGHLHHEIMKNGYGNEEQKPTPQSGKKGSNMKTEFSGSHRELVLGLPCSGQFEIHRSQSSTSSKRLGGGGERNIVFASHKRALGSKEAAAGSSLVAANNTPVGRPKKKNKTMKNGEVREDDEYARIKKKLRYFLNRINYEQNLIDAYSLEGWRGSSLEKLRPEKELERARKVILQQKVKIRDLFQHLDTLCAEGSLPESLFDSDGGISSEDIFCAKCHSKDLSVDNDIILCDGFCDRGFHQYCLEPPLRKEDIPPDNESWLCPGCDCKDDSLDLLNYCLGTKFSVSDSWEKIFPEAVAVLAGGDQNLNCDLPSDDSDDEEYDPDGLNDEDNSDDNEESENEDGSSDDSDFTSASDEMIESFKEGKDIMKDIMALPSDDSEDDDYDPEAPTHDEDDIQESSNSDSTSDSEDIETSLKGNESKQENEDAPFEDLGRKKSQLLYDTISESDAVVDDGLAGVPRRRNIERLDYKKLYDEEYENVQSSSSDDEDWDKTARMGKENSESEDEGDTVPLKQSSNAEDHTSKKPRRKSKKADKTDTLEVPQQGPGENGCSGENSSSSANTQTNPKTQRLNLSFQENRYPDKATKESLAKELQMTIVQVNNWFKNRRTSSNSKLVVLEGAVKKSKTGNKGECETSVAGSSKQTIKLYDEECENVQSSSSDDEDWDKIARMGKKKSESEDEGDTMPLKQSSNAEDHTSKKPRRNLKRADKMDTLKLPQGPGENGCSGERSSSSAFKQADLKTQRLNISFQDNRYPDNATKESLAKELQMTIVQVNNWFKNRRRSSLNSKPVVSEEDVKKSRTGNEGECEASVAESSKQTMETLSVAENKSVASESSNPGSRKRRRKVDFGLNHEG